MKVGQTKANELIKYIGPHAIISVEKLNGFFSAYETTQEHLDKLRLISRMHPINVKGYINKIFFDNVLMKTYQDVQYGNGVIFFVGTDDELDEYCMWLAENEGKIGLKMI